MQIEAVIEAHSWLPFVATLAAVDDDQEKERRKKEKLDVAEAKRQVPLPGVSCAGPCCCSESVTLAVCG